MSNQKVYDEFNLIDVDKKGSVSFEQVLAYLGKIQDISNPQIKLFNEMFFYAADGDDDGKLSLDEFSNFMKAVDQSNPIISMVGSFKMVDKERKGYLTLEQYGEYLSKLNFGVTKEEIIQDFMETDTNSDGKVQLDEFIMALIFGGYEIDEEHEKEYEDIFKQLDTEKTGKINLKQFLSFYVEENCPKAKGKTEQQKEALFRGFNNGNDGLLSKTDFVRLMSAKEYDPEDESTIIYYALQLIGEFRVMDVDHNESIPIDVCVNYLSKLIEGYDEDDIISAFVEILDEDGNGTIQLDEYLLFCLLEKDKDIKISKSSDQITKIIVHSVNNVPNLSCYCTAKYYSRVGNEIKKKSKVFKSNGDVTLEFDFNISGDVKEVLIELKEYNRILSSSVICSTTLSKDDIKKMKGKTFEPEGELSKKFIKKVKLIPCFKIEILN